MPYTVPSFDQILNAMLTDYKNLNGGVSVDTLIARLRAYEAQYGSVPDISMEALVRMACHASALWGAYIYQEYIAKQPFPDTADTENLNHHGSVQNVGRTAVETDADYLARILDDIQNPAAGGNQYDLRQWAEEIAGVAKAYVFPLAQGDGTADIVVVADLAATGSEIPSSGMRKGTATTITAGKLIDAAGTFTTVAAVAVGDIVRNTFQGTEARVVTVDSAIQLSLDVDIFKYVGENYHVHMHTGTNTTATANKLIDTAALFDNATYTIKKGDVVKNLTDNTQASVVTIDSAIQLSLDADIFTATAKAYVVESLLARVKENVDAKRLVTASKIAVLAPSILTQAVTMGVTGANVDKVKLAADITALLNGYIPDQKLYLSQLTTLAIERGAEDAAVTVPAAFPVTPATYQMIRPGVMTVT